MKVGEVVTTTTLNKEFDGYAVHVLREKIKALPRAKRERQKWEILVDLPSKAEYRKQRDARYTTTVDDLVNGAISEMGSLGEELEDICQNTPENLQQTDAYQAREEAASKCQDIDEIEVPEPYATLPLVYLPGEGTSRKGRADEAVAMLEAAKEAIENHREPEELDSEGNPTEEGEDWELPEEAVSVIEEIDNAISAIQDIEFPGMFG